MIEVDARICHAPRISGVGFKVIRRGEAVRFGSVAAEIINRLTNQVSEQERPIDSDQQRQGDTSAGQCPAPLCAASVTQTPEPRAGVAHSDRFQGHSP